MLGVISGAWCHRPPPPGRRPVTDATLRSRLCSYLITAAGGLSAWFAGDFL